VDIIKSVYFSQAEILDSIQALCGIDRFECDLTYGNGSFYKDRSKPFFRFDLDSELNDVDVCCSTKTPLKSASIGSCVFDPPFLTYVRSKRQGNGSMVMAKRFSGYWKYDELQDHYMKTIREAARIIKPSGVLIFKCQDIIHNHKMHCTHANILNWSKDWFRLKDLFILCAKHRMPMPNKKGTQKHARIFHSYFLVLQRNKIELSEEVVG
jgi:tRNA G10  N-methylase Trm11